MKPDHTNSFHYAGRRAADFPIEPPSALVRRNSRLSDDQIAKLRQEWVRQHRYANALRTEHAKAKDYALGIREKQRRAVLALFEGENGVVDWEEYARLRFEYEQAFGRSPHEPAYPEKRSRAVRRPRFTLGNVIAGALLAAGLVLRSPYLLMGGLIVFMAYELG